MKVLVTGANGFIGKNLVLRLREQADTDVLTFVRGQEDAALQDALGQCDAVVHLAGENRPADVQAFAEVNTGLTERVCQARCLRCCTIIHVFEGGRYGPPIESGVTGAGGGGDRCRSRG